MTLRTLWLAVAIVASPLVANAQISADVSFNWSAGVPPGEAVPSTDVFYDQLAPYGVWVDDPAVGEAFIPDQLGYVPYTNGHWENTDVGFVWISDEPFAWATSHYGRWWYSDDYGRWLWVPDTTWGPAWVDWYEADGDLGWAPLAPDIVVEAGYQIPIDAYHYCSAEHVLDPDVARYYVPSRRVETFYREARPIAHRATIGSHQVVAGPAPARLAALNVRAPVVKHVAPRLIGRMPPTEARAAEQRAKQRKPQIEQQNARRLQAHAEIQKAVRQRETNAPGRANPRNPAVRNPAVRNPAVRNPAVRNPNPAVNNIERTKEPSPATPNAATQRPDLNHRNENRVRNRAEPRQPDLNRKPTRPEPPRAEPQRAMPPPPEAPRPEPQRAMPPRSEPPHPEPTHAAPPRPEPPRPEPMHAAPPRPAPPRPEPMHAAPPRPEPPRPEPMHAGPPRPQPEPHAPPARGRDDRNKHKP